MTLSVTVCCHCDICTVFFGSLNVNIFRLVFSYYKVMSVIYLQANFFQFWKCFPVGQKGYFHSLESRELSVSYYCL